MNVPAEISAHLMCGFWAVIVNGTRLITIIPANFLIDFDLFIKRLLVLTAE
jgi:hypothetical protein